MASQDFGASDSVKIVATRKEIALDLGGVAYPAKSQPMPAKIQDADGNWIAMDAARALMDDDICEQIHGTVDSEQAFFDAYVIAHAAKYDGEKFTVN